MGDLLEARRQEFCEALAKEQGKPMANAKEEMAGLLAMTRRHAEAAGDWLMPKVTHEDETARFEIHYLPRGVAGAVTPWNFPLSLAGRMIMSAVLTGNTCILKPPPYTPLTAVMLSDVCKEAFP